MDSKQLLRTFLQRAAMENNQALADALWLDAEELRRTARELIAHVSKKVAGGDE